MDSLYTSEELAQYLNVKIRTIYTWVQMGAIPHYRLSRKAIRFNINAVNAWLDKEKAQ